MASNHRWNMNLCLVVLTAGLLYSTSGAAAEKRLPVIEDQLRLENLWSPDFAPDGERIAYVVETANTDSDATVSDLWLTDYGTGDSRRLTHTPFHSEWLPRWSPDGQWLAFLADRGNDETTQVWVLPADGGEARQLSRLEGGVEDYAWAPDSERLVVVAEDPPPEAGKDSRGEDKPEPPWVITRLQFKEDYRGYLTDRYRHLHLVNLADGKSTKLTGGSYDHLLPAWSPDGRLISFISKRDHDEPDRTLDHDVFVMAPEPGSPPRRISALEGTDVDPYWESRPQWSPDSRRLVWLQSTEDKWIYYAPWQLTVADIETGEITKPARIDRCFFKPRWSPDGQSIYALVEQSRVTWLAKIDPREADAEKAVKYLREGNRFGYDFALAGNGRVVVLEGDDMTPYELRTVERNSRTLGDHNAFLDEVALQPAEDFSFDSDGHRIDAMLMYPAGYRAGTRYPAIARVHGGPVWQFSHELWFDWQVFAANGYAVIGINPRGSSGRGFDFSRAIYADWGNVDVKDVLAGVDHMVAIGVADPERLAVGGRSYGGMLTNYLIASDTRFRAAESGAGTSNMIASYGHDQYVREYEFELGRPWNGLENYVRVSFPFLHADRIETPTLFYCAEKDFNVPCLGAEQMYQALRSLGIPTQLVIYPGEHHGMTVPSYLQDRLRRSLRWYDRYLKAQ